MKEELDGWSMLMKGFRFFLVSAAIFAVATISVWSQAEHGASAPTMLGEVVVTATRVPTANLDVPAFVTVISEKQIEASSATTLAGLLRMQGNVNVASNGPQGAVSTVRMRGSTSSEVLVMVNGVRINSSRDGTVDLSQIPLNTIKRIEIVRGGESSVYGSDAIGGTINIITKSSAKPLAQVRIENGSYLPHNATVVTDSGKSQAEANPLDLVDTQKVSAEMAGKAGSADLTASGGFTRAANGFVWDDTTYLGGWRRENHAGGLSANGYANVTVPVAGGSLGATGTIVYSNYDSPGSLQFAPTSQAAQGRTTASGVASFSTPRFLVNPLSLTVHGYYQYDDLRYTDPSSDIDSRHVTNTAGGDFTQKLSVSDLASFIYGASARYDDVDSTDIGQKSRFNLAGFLSAPICATGSITLTPSIRYDYFSDFASGLSYRLGAVAALNESSSLKASLYESYAVPTLNELYWPASAYSQGNPNLKPETSYGGDFGYSMRTTALSVDAALFGRYILDQIIWTSTLPSAPENLGRSFVPGMEIEARANITGGIALSINYTFMYSLLLADSTATYVLADDKRVPWVPMHTLAASISYSHGGSRLALDEQYVSKQYTDGANTESSALSGYVVFDISYRQTIGSHFTLSFVVKNLFNEVYETQVGYPMPPLSIWTGLEAKL